MIERYFGCPSCWEVIQPAPFATCSCDELHEWIHIDMDGKERTEDEFFAQEISEERVLH